MSSSRGKRRDKQRDSGKEVGVVMSVMRERGCSWRWGNRRKKEEDMEKVSTTFLNEPRR